MRFFCFLLLLGVLALVLNGCGDGSSQADLTVNVVNQQTGDPVADSIVYLLGSNITTQFTSNASGTVRIPNVRTGGPYSLLIVPPAGTAPALIGPLTMPGEDQTVVAETLTYAQLLSTYGVAQPTNNTATVVAFGYERLNGTAPAREVRLTVDSTSDTGNPAVVTDIPVPPVGHNIFVTDVATGLTVEVPSAQQVPNTVLVVRALFANAR